MGMLDGMKLYRENLPKGIKRGDIFYVNNKEQGQVGSEMKKDRPAVIVSCDANNGHSDVVEVVFLTSQPKKEFPTHVDMHSTGRKSVAICEQPTPVAIQRVKNYIGRATEEEMQGIDEALALFFELKRQHVLEKYIRNLEVDVGNLYEEVQKWKNQAAKAEEECEMYKKMHQEIMVILEGMKGT